MDEQLAWQAERDAVVRRQAILRAEAEEMAVERARQAEAQDARDVLWHRYQATGEPVPSHADILARARSAAEAEADDRDMNAPYGSASRPAVFMTAADGSPIEVSGPAAVARSVSEAYDDNLLQQAKRSSEDSFMAVQIARFHARRAHQAEAERTVARRQLERELGYDEISR